MSSVELSIGEAKGLHLRFANGWTISIQIGPGNYCDNYTLNSGMDMLKFMEQPAYKAKISSTTAEIAIFRPDDSWYKFEDGQDVKAYVPMEEVLEWIDKVKKGELV